MLRTNMVFNAQMLKDNITTLCLHFYICANCVSLTNQLKELVYNIPVIFIMTNARKGKVIYRLHI